MTGETRWVTVRTPQIGDMAQHNSERFDPRPVVTIRLRQDEVQVQLKTIDGGRTRWLPAGWHTFKRAELVPDLEPTDAEVAAFVDGYANADTLYVQAGLRAAFALRAGEPS